MSAPAVASSPASPALSSLFVVRAGRPSDHPHVFESWSHSVEDPRVVPGTSLGVHRAGVRRVVAELLERPRAQLFVACAPGDENTILGWALVEHPDVLHFVHVKRFIRHKGIARVLVGLGEPEQRDRPMRHTFRTPSFAPWTRQGSWIFDPFLAFAPVPR